MFFRMSAATQANHDFSKEHGNKDEKVDQFAANVSVFAKKALQRKKLARNIDPEGRSFPLYQYVTLAKWCALIAKSELFGNFVLLCIVLAGALVGLQTYPEFSSSVVLKSMDMVVLYVFTFEVVVKIVGEGMQPELYFIGSNWKWNMFDFLIVFSSLPIVPGMEGNIAFLRLIRLLRLAKVFRKVPQLQMIIVGLVGGLKSIVYIVVLLFLVFYLYAIVGIFFFRDNDPWHFRSVEISLLTLLSVATLEGWAGVMYINYYGCDVYPGDYYFNDISERTSNKLGSAMLCTYPSPQPVLALFYFVSFIFVCSFSMLSLFIGAVTVSMSEAMDTVREEKEKKGMKKKLRDAERKMIAMQLGRAKLDYRLRRKLIVLEKAFIGDDIEGEILDDEVPSNVFLRKYKELSVLCQQLSASSYFNNFVTFIIILAGVVVGLNTDQYIRVHFAQGLSVLDTVIQAIFTIECAVKIIAEEFTPWKYFDNNWNTFDLLVVCGSYANVGGGLIILLRLLRLLRVLKLMRALPQLQVIVTALMSGGTSIMFISVLLFLFYYFAGIIAMILFSKNDPVHFGTLHFTILTLFQCSTLDNWVNPLFVNLYGCDVIGYDDYPEKCTHPDANFFVTALFFMVFIVLGALVLLTLFIGVVTTGMDEAAFDQKEALEIEAKTRKVAEERNISEHLVEAYKEVFEMIDLNGGNTIEIGELKLGLKAAGRSIADANLLALWKQVDKDNSGGIDFSEFLTFMLNLRAEGDSRRSIKGTAFTYGPDEKLVDVDGVSTPATSVRNETNMPDASLLDEQLKGPSAYGSPEGQAGTAEDRQALPHEIITLTTDQRPKSSASVAPKVQAVHVSSSRPGSRAGSSPGSRQGTVEPAGGTLMNDADEDLEGEYRPVAKPKPSRKPQNSSSSSKVVDSGDTWLHQDYGNIDAEGDNIVFINNHSQVMPAQGEDRSSNTPEVSPMRPSKSHWHPIIDNDASLEARQREYDQRAAVHNSLKLALQARHASFDNFNDSPQKSGDIRKYNSTKSGKGIPGGRRVISKMCYI